MLPSGSRSAAKWQTPESHEFSVGQLALGQPAQGGAKGQYARPVEAEHLPRAAAGRKPEGLSPQAKKATRDEAFLGPYVAGAAARAKHLPAETRVLDVRCRRESTSRSCRLPAE